MAEGKFSKPRNRFQEPLPGQKTPAVPEQKVKPKYQREQPAPLQEYPLSAESVEEEAMDLAFAQTREEEGWLQRLTAMFSGGNKKLLLVGICSAAAALIALVIGFVAFSGVSDPYDGKILNNVLIGNIHVGGLTRSQAEEVVRSATENTFEAQDMVVVLPDTTLRFSPADTGARLDVKAVVKAAYQYGRTGSAQQQEAAYQASLTGNHIIAMLPYMELDQDFILGKIQEYADSFGSTYSEYSFRLEGDMPKLGHDEHDPNAPCQTLMITLGTPGLGIDTEDLFEKILDAYSFNTFQVSLTSVVPSSVPAPPDIDAIHAAVYIAPVDATMNQQTFEPIPGSYGYTFDKAAAQRLVDQADFGQTVEIPMQYIESELEGDELLFQDILGYCESPHNTSEKRTHNLRRVCELINDYILMPGDEFSYNDVVGERTTARGFQSAPAYSGTKLVDSVGGGVCQGSSTLYYCALVADMEITDRINHGLPVTYLPIGLDATVNWGGPDFKFRNSSNYPVKIVAEVSDGYMRIWIMGTEERDYYVELTSEITGITKSEPRYVDYPPESGYKNGQMIEAGSDGYTVRSYKLRYDRETGELISKDFIVLSSYMMVRTTVARVPEPDPEPTDPPAGGGEGTEGEGSGDGGGSTPPPSGGDGGGSTPPPSGGDGGGSTPPPSGGDGGGSTPPPSGGDGGGSTPPPSGGDGGGSTPPPSGGDSGGSTPPPSGGDSGGSTPPPSGDGT